MQLFRVEVTATDPHGASATSQFWLGQGRNLLSGGTAGSDLVESGNGDGDILFGGQGRDFLDGANPSDMFVVSVGDDLTIVEENGFLDSDILVLDGLSVADAEFARRVPGSSDLVISAAGVPIVLVRGTLNGSSTDQIERFAFADGTILEPADIRAILVAQSQTDGADQVAGFTSAETINGGMGDDFLSGDDGIDTYLFAIGDGQDVIEDNGFFDNDVALWTGPRPRRRSPADAKPKAAR